MRKFLIILICMGMLVCGCESKSVEDVSKETVAQTTMLKKGDSFSITGIVDYSDKPSDIGQEYCFVTGKEEIAYYYTDIYNEESQWKSKVFYTKGNDTNLLKEYVGQEVTISGIFDAESHGIPYITCITVSENMIKKQD